MFIKELLEKFPNADVFEVYIEAIGYTLPFNRAEITEWEHEVNEFYEIDNVVYINYNPYVTI